MEERGGGGGGGESSCRPASRVPLVGLLVKGNQTEKPQGSSGDERDDNSSSDYLFL